VEGIEQTINSPHVSEGLIALNQSLQAARSLFTELNRDVPRLARQLNATLDSARGTIQRADMRLERLVRELHLASRAVEGAFKQMEGTLSLDTGKGKKIATGMMQTLETARATLEQAKASLAAVEDLAGKSEIRRELSQALGEVSSTARSIRSLARFLERHPEALLRGKGGH
jgi:paraquat-inducible protein B